MNKLSANQQIIVDAVTSGLTTAAAIAEKTGLTKAAVSANMKPLRDKGVITTTEVNGVLTISLTGEAKAARVDAAFEKAAKPAAKKVVDHPAPASVTITGPAVDGFRPRDIVQQLIAQGTPKKVAKNMVYNSGLGRNNWRMGE